MGRTCAVAECASVARTRGRRRLRADSVELRKNLRVYCRGAEEDGSALLSRTGGAPCAVHALCEKWAILWKVAGAVDHLVHIVWVCPVLPCVSAAVRVWDKYGPQRPKGCFREFQMGIHGGAYKGRLHSQVPFIGCKTLTVWQKTYTDIHGYCRARVKHLFASLWSWRVVCDIRLGFVLEGCA